MKWYEIIFVVIMWIVGVYIYTLYKDFQKNKYHNDSFKKNKE